MFFVIISSRLKIQMCHCHMALRAENQYRCIVVHGFSEFDPSYDLNANVSNENTILLMGFLFRRPFVSHLSMSVHVWSQFCHKFPQFTIKSLGHDKSDMRENQIFLKKNHDKILDNHDCAMIMNRRDMLLIVVTSPWLLIKAWLDIDRLYGTVAD